MLSKKEKMEIISSIGKELLQIAKAFDFEVRKNTLSFEYGNNDLMAITKMSRGRYCVNISRTSGQLVVHSSTYKIEELGAMFQRETWQELYLSKTFAPPVYFISPKIATKSSSRKMSQVRMGKYIQSLDKKDYVLASEL